MGKSIILSHHLLLHNTSRILLTTTCCLYCLLRSVLWTSSDAVQCCFICGPTARLLGRRRAETRRMIESLLILSVAPQIGRHFVDARHSAPLLQTPHRSGATLWPQRSRRLPSWWGGGPLPPTPASASALRASILGAFGGQSPPKLNTNQCP